MTEELHNTPLIMVRWSRKHCAKLLSCSSLWAVEQERGKSHFKNAPLKSQTISQILYVIVLRGSQEQGLYIGRSPPESVSVCVCVRVCGRVARTGDFLCWRKRALDTSSSLLCAAKKARGQMSGWMKNSELHADRSGFRAGGGEGTALEQ